MSKKKKKLNLIKEIVIGVLGACICTSSQVFRTALNQVSAKTELERLKEDVSIIKSDFLITRHNGIADLILVIGICVVILAGLSAFNKIFDWRKK